MPGRLEGKVAIVTGAARGQGRSHAVRMAEEGADIIAVDLCADVATVKYPLGTADDLAETAHTIEKLDRRVQTYQADVRDSAALRSAVADGVSALGRLDIVVANAGIASYAPVLDLDDETWQDVIDINLTGVWRTVKATVPHIIAGGHPGSVVITSSVAGLKGYYNCGHYVAAKHGLVGLMRTLANELAAQNVRVNTVHPTTVNTGMFRNDESYHLFVPEVEDPSMDQVAAAARMINALDVPWIEPVDVSNAVVYLASDEARYVTGVTLPVDAGMLIK